MCRRVAIPVIGVLLAVSLILSISVGPAGWKAPWAWQDSVVALRLPRAVLSGVVGGALAVAGLAMQALLRNDLADPYILGVSGGASTGAVSSLALLPGFPPGIGAAVGATVAAAVVRGIARGPYDATRLLLAGVAVSSMLMSATGMVLVLAPSEALLRSSTYWLFGGFGTPGWSSLVAPAVLLVGVSGWMHFRAERLDRLILGEDVATSLGVNVNRLRGSILLSSVLLTAASVAAAGLIGFVGLIAPHAARLFVGPTHRRLLPTAALAGATLVVAADAVARTAFAPRELPVGLLTAAVGGPFFLTQLQRGAS